ncbi:hypothetical protein ACFUNF_38310 [Streptomyces sp. NPDC057291]|uniref:hypothetical protein n=1 Tax=Streptomyces sp. NPDC057291 TaxID=3346087 RepID=UPI003637E8A8
MPDERTHTRRTRTGTTRPPAPTFGRPSPALNARAERGYARFLAHITQVPDASTGDHDQDDGARHR